MRQPVDRLMKPFGFLLAHLPELAPAGCVGLDGTPRCHRGLRQCRLQASIEFGQHASVDVFDFPHSSPNPGRSRGPGVGSDG